MKLPRSAVCLALAFMVAVPAAANELSLPAHARQLADRASPLDSYALPVGPFDAGSVPVRNFEGQTKRQSWRLDGSGTTTLQILAPLRDQIEAAGYDILYECRDKECGGFDFRFGVEVIPAPDMHVNIGDYRYLGAVRGDQEALGLLVSGTGNATHIQLIHIFPNGSTQQLTPVLNGTIPKGQAKQQGGLGETLVAEGHVILTDLVFETGATDLGKGPFSSLKQLAEFLQGNPDSRIALVGHTDTVGSLDNNIALSKRRAGSVRKRLSDQYGIEPERIEAEGMGYLAPVDSNLTRQGREANRRVEAILLSQ